MVPVFAGEYIMEADKGPGGEKRDAKIYSPFRVYSEGTLTGKCDKVNILSRSQRSRVVDLLTGKV